MEPLVVLQIASKVTMREISLLNFGMCPDMIDTKIAGLFSTPKLTVRNEISCLFENIIDN